MISSKYNLFHLQPVDSGSQNAPTNDYKGHQQAGRTPAQDTLEGGSVCLSKRSSEVVGAVNYVQSIGSSSVYLDPGSQSYFYLVNALSVMERGPESIESRLGPISRKTMRISQLRAMKEVLKSDDERRRNEIERCLSKIASDEKDFRKEIKQEDIDSLLKKLSDFHQKKIKQLEGNGFLAVV